MIRKIFRISAASMSLMTKGAYLKLFLKICRENNSGSKGLSIGNCKTKNLTNFNGINWLKMGQIFIFFWLELFSNMLSVIIWKQNFEKFNRTGAIAPLLPIGPITIPSTITISALTSKVLRNSNFSQRHWVFPVFPYQMDTSNNFQCRYFPCSINLVFYYSICMAKIEKNLWSNCYCFLFHIYISNFKKTGLKIQIRPSSP